MASVAAACKGFTATVFAATVAIILSGGDVNRILALFMSFLPIVVFALFDSYYFAKELQYRDLYNAVLEGIHDIDFDMRVGKMTASIRSRVLKSISILPFYLVFTLAYIGIFVLLFCGCVS